MRSALLVLLLFGAGCAQRPTPPSPYLPKETMYTTGSTLAATGGLVGMAVGAQLMDPRQSATTRQAGTAIMAAGGALMLGALVDAVAVDAERRKFVTLWNAGLRQQMGSGTPGDRPFRDPPPPAPDIPFRFATEDEEPER